MQRLISLAMLLALGFFVSATVHASDPHDDGESSSEYYYMGNSCAFIGGVILSIARMLPRNSPFDTILVYSNIALLSVSAGCFWYEGSKIAKKEKKTNSNVGLAVGSTLAGATVGHVLMSDWLHIGD